MTAASSHGKSTLYRTLGCATCVFDSSTTRGAQLRHSQLRTSTMPNEAKEETKDEAKEEAKEDSPEKTASGRSPRRSAAKKVSYAESSDEEAMMADSEEEKPKTKKGKGKGSVRKK